MIETTLDLHLEQTLIVDHGDQDRVAGTRPFMGTLSSRTSHTTREQAVLGRFDPGLSWRAIPRGTTGPPGSVALRGCCRRRRRL